MNASVLDSEGRLNSEDFVAWTPIGGDGVYFPGEFSEDGPEVCFSGEFNGNGHTISGLYFKNPDVNNIGLFGKAAGNAHIHDLGIKDSYFYGKNHVGGICGDFASGRIENCWNGAYVMAHDYDAGGISGSCYVNASIANCYNIGIVSTYEEKGGTQDSRFGGICGSVYSSSATYSIDNCYTLKSRSIPHDGDPYEGLPNVSGDCEKIHGMLVDGCPASKIHDSHVMKAEAFTGGEVCYRLNYGVTDGSQKWYQTLGRDLLPVMDKDHKTIYYGYNSGLKYSNTPISVGAIHCRPIAATCSAGYTRDCWEDRVSYNIYAEPACLNQLNAAAVVFYKPLASDPTDQINQGEVDGWTQEKNQTYGGVNFDYAAVKVFKDYDDGTKNYTADEWVSFKVTEENAYRDRLKWSCTGDKTKMNDGRYGSCTLTYRVNGGAETTLTIPSTPFEDSPEVLSHYMYNRDVTSYRLFKDDVVEFHIKNYQNACKTPCEVTWAVTLEYVQRHDIQQIEATPVTCTEKGNKENWYCSKCDTHFADYNYTIVMTDWEIPALGHSIEYHQHKDATCAEDGNIEYWHCTRCNLNYSDEDNPLSLKSDFILSLCELIVGGKDGLAPVEKTIIDRCVRLVYRDYLNDPKPENMPILEDLYNELRAQEEKEAQYLATALEIYVTGSLNVFNHRSNIDINNRIVSFDIKELGKQLKKIGMLVVQDAVWNRVTINREAQKSTWYYIDEMHLLLKEEQTAAYTVEIWKRFRKWGGIPTGITQNVKDLLSSREVENIFENSDFVYMLNQAAGDRQILAKQLNISPHQLSYVTHSGEGEGLLFYGNTIIPFVDHFPKNTELYGIMTTKLQEVAK